jgi:tRNA (cmo5U34)-methyltransferase
MEVLARPRVSAWHNRRGGGASPPISAIITTVSSEWKDPARVTDYLSREIPHRDVAERMLLETLPERVKRALDLGTGDGRMLALVLSAHPQARGVGIDNSEPMLASAAERFADNPGVELEAHDLHKPLTVAAAFDVVVSGLAIHHLSDQRKRDLFSEVRSLLAPGGVFVNLDLMAPASPQLHQRFRQAIGRVQDDPADQLAGLCEQLSWLRDVGFDEVECHFKWLELALIVAVRPGS